MNIWRLGCFSGVFWNLHSDMLAFFEVYMQSPTCWHNKET